MNKLTIPPADMATDSIHYYDPRTGQHRVQIVVEAFMAEIGADIDQFHAAIVPLRAHGNRRSHRIQ